MRKVAERFDKEAEKNAKRPTPPAFRLIARRGLKYSWSISDSFNYNCIVNET